MRRSRRCAALVTVLGSLILLATPAAAQQTVAGDVLVAWGDGPEGPHVPYVIGADGNRINVVLDPAALQALGGIGRLENRRLSISGDFLNAPTADAAGLFMGFDAQVVATAKVAADATAAARDSGTARVIVFLDASFVPEGLLPNAAAVTDQQNGIAAARAAALADIPAGEFSLRRQFDEIPIVSGDATAAGLAALEASSAVLRVMVDYPMRPLLADSAVLIGANTAWSMGFTGDRHMVAVLDTGVLKTHSFFGGRVATEACYSSAGANLVHLCPGGVDTTAVNSGMPTGCVGVSGCDHGTHVAGIAAGAAYSGTGAVTFSGVGRAARIAAIQVFTRNNSSASCGGSAPCLLAYNDDLLAGLTRVYDLRNTYKIASANMSIGGGLYSPPNCDTGNPLLAIINNLRSVGIATVVAAGNDSSRTQISYPACTSSAISVGSTTKAPESVSSFSNASTQMTMWAPGSSITSSVITSTTSFGAKSGTSMAAPHVAGAWTILKEKRPYALGDEIRNAITSTGLSITDTRTGGSVTKPRIRVPNALNAINFSTPVVQLWNSVTTGTVITLWARVQNTGTVALPANDAVWFWVDGYGYVGSTSVAGLAPGGLVWYPFNWTIPANASGAINYWARVWDGAQGGFWTGAWAGPQAINVGYPAPITQLWPPYDQGGSNTINRGDTTRLWAYVSNNRTAVLPAAGVYFNVAPTGPFPMTWVGATAINPLAPATSAWRLFNWVVPAAQPTGAHQYHAQSWYLSGTWRAWSTFYGPQAFVVSP